MNSRIWDVRSLEETNFIEYASYIKIFNKQFRIKYSLAHKDFYTVYFIKNYEPSPDEKLIFEFKSDSFFYAEAEYSHLFKLEAGRYELYHSDEEPNVYVLSLTDKAKFKHSKK